VARITVAPRGENRWLVRVREGATSTEHEVTVTPDHLIRYAGPGMSPERLLEVSFEFLLEREPKESILSTFDLSVIERYFPEYLRKIRATL
jgi:hypothetical protein